MATIFEQIQSEVDLNDVLDYYGYEPQKVFSGSVWYCCPLHHEKTPSFRVLDNKFQCFGCQEYGDVVNFLKLHNQDSFPNILKFLKEEFNFQEEASEVKPKANRLKEREKKEIQFRKELTKQAGILHNLCVDYQRAQKALDLNWELLEKLAVQIENLGMRFTNFFIMHGYHLISKRNLLRLALEAEDDFWLNPKIRRTLDYLPGRSGLWLAGILSYDPEFKDYYYPSEKDQLPLHQQEK